MGILDKLFGTRSEREVKRLLPTVDKIEALSDEYAALSDEALRAKEGLGQNKGWFELPGETHPALSLIHI